MSISTGIDKTNVDLELKNRFYPDLIPWSADPRGDMTLGAVLQQGNSAFIPGTTTAQDATDFNILGCVKIETGTIGMGNQPALVIGEPGDILQIKGGTALGSILVGNGADTEELVCPTTTTTATTGTIYNWLSLANGQSRDFFVSNGSLYQLGYSITIVYSGTDSITGTITAIAGQLITITITAFTSAVYTPAALITTTPPDPVTATSGGADPTFIFNPAVCTPATIPNNSFLLTGLCYLYGAPPVVGSSNISLTAQASPPAINGTTSIFSIPQYENPPVSTSAFSWGSAGCFIPDGTSVTLASNAGGNQLAFAFPSGGSFIDQDFTGSVSGYTLAYTPNGVITINSKLVLTADNTKPLGVFWGVDAQGVGTITSVSAGTNISVSGSLSAPVVNLATPTTSNIQIGVGTEIIAVNGDITMSIDSTGLNDKYINGGVINEEDIAVSSTSVVNSISTTNTTQYQNSSVITCNTTGVSDIKTAVDIATTETGTTTIQVQPTSCIMGIGCVLTGSPANTEGSVILSTTATNPAIQLAQSTPFSTSYITTIDRDGIIQNNSGGNGFRCRSAQDIFLEPTHSQPNPQLGVIRVPNGNSINMSVDTYTTTYRKDGVGIQDTFLPSSYSSTADLTSTGGNSQVFLGSTNVGTSSHFLRCEVPLVGNATITHDTQSGAIRDLVISTEGRMNILSGNTGFLLQGSPTGGGNIQGSSTGVITINGGNSATGTIIANAGTATGNANPVQIQSSGAGGAALPMLRMENTNATGSVATEIYKNKPTAGANGDVLYTQSVFGKDSGNTKQEYTRITHTIRDATAGAEDGSLELGCFVNGGFANFIQLNANDAPIGEVNFTRPLDFIGGSDANSTIKTSGTGSVNLNLDATTSAGTGAIALKTKNGTAGSGAGLLLTGNTIISPTSGGSAGQHLCLTINGVVYKIQLLNP